MPKRDVFNMVLIGVVKAFADYNNKRLSPQERDYMVNELTGNIIARYPAIRINEIPIAIANGIRGKYGEFYGLSVVAFEWFIEQYLLSEVRIQAVKSLSAPGTARPVPDKQQQFATAKSNTLMALHTNRQVKVSLAWPVRFMIFWIGCNSSGLVATKSTI